MSQFRDRTSGAIFSASQLRANNKDRSMPNIWTDATLDALNVDRILPSTKPDPSSDYVSVVQTGATQDGEGRWIQQWGEVTVYEDYTSTDDDGNEITVTAAQQLADKQAADEAALAKVKRAYRTELLRETDYAALFDVTMSDEMRAYRQALRDVPQQAGFPATIIWPTKPE